MTAVLNLYAAQPFWIWLAIGVLLLAIESMASTEWLLWPAVAAGGVAQCYGVAADTAAAASAIPEVTAGT